MFPAAESELVLTSAAAKQLGRPGHHLEKLGYKNQQSSAIDRFILHFVLTGRPSSTKCI